MQLKQFQKEDLKAVEDFKYKALLALEMGLGKTVEALALIQKTNSFPAVVVCPKGLKRQWAEMAWEMFGMSSTIIQHREPYDTEDLRREQLIIINYDLLPKWIPYLYWLPPKLVAVDECQLIGNMKSQRCGYVRQLCLKVPKVLMLSGTPFVNYPWELYPTLHILRPRVFDSPFSFASEYCDCEKSFGKWKFSGGKNLEKLHRVLLETCMVRRTMAEVASELPPLIRSVVPLDIEEREDYNDAERDLITWLARTDMAKAIRAARSQRYTQFTYLKHLAAKKKLGPVMEWIDTTLSETECKILVGTIHKDITYPLHERYKDISVVIDGSKTEAQRDLAKTLFQRNEETRLLFCQINAGGVGLNIPEAEIVALVELPWSHSVCLQFIKRAHRLTSTKPVRAYFLVGYDTIEEVLCKIIQKKQKEADMVLDGVPVKDESLQLFDELQRALIEKRKDRK